MNKTNCILFLEIQTKNDLIFFFFTLWFLRNNNLDEYLV